MLSVRSLVLQLDNLNLNLWLIAAREPFEATTLFDC